jgi:hypothetical protein
VAPNRKENPMSDQPTRRNFLQNTIITAASLLLPRMLARKVNPNSFWFLHLPTGDSWGVDDPISWSLKNARRPILERARERLVTLDASDPQRVIRLVVRRCKLNLLEVRPGQVVAHYWGQDGQADLRPFFKQHHLARKNVWVILIDRKREASTVQFGEDFLYGERLTKIFPMKLFMSKYAKREINEADDWRAAPLTRSGFAWEGIEPNRIPWAALKSAWRRTSPMLCLNCDQPTLLSNFGFPRCSVFNRKPYFIHVCRRCRRSFEDNTVKNVPRWIEANLEVEVWPDFEMIWNSRVKWERPAPDTMAS